ncbi:unnamed protein product, partial [Tetraodon nigroviridis]
GTASPACGCAMVRKTVKMELMSFSVVNQLLLHLCAVIRFNDSVVNGWKWMGR